MWEKLLELNEWKVQQAKAWSAASQSTDCRSMRCRLRGSKSQLWLKSWFAYLRLFRVDASSLVLFCRHKVFPDSSVSAPSLFLVLTSRSLACWHFLIRSVVKVWVVMFSSVIWVISKVVHDMLMTFGSRRVNEFRSTACQWVSVTEYKTS